jgi:hypothetical protein
MKEEDVAAGLLEGRDARSARRERDRLDGLDAEWFDDGVVGGHLRAQVSGLRSQAGFRVQGSGFGVQDYLTTGHYCLLPTAY